MKEIGRNWLRYIIVPDALQPAAPKKKPLADPEGVTNHSLGDWYSVVISAPNLRNKWPFSFVNLSSSIRSSQTFSCTNIWYNASPNNGGMWERPVCTREKTVRVCWHSWEKEYSFLASMGVKVVAMCLSCYLRTLYRGHDHLQDNVFPGWLETAVQCFRMSSTSFEGLLLKVGKAFLASFFQNSLLSSCYAHIWSSKLRWNVCRRVSTFGTPRPPSEGKGRRTRDTLREPVEPKRTRTEFFLE